MQITIGINKQQLFRVLLKIKIGPLKLKFSEAILKSKMKSLMSHFNIIYQ